MDIVTSVFSFSFSWEVITLFSMKNVCHVFFTHSREGGRLIERKAITRGVSRSTVRISAENDA